MSVTALRAEVPNAPHVLREYAVIADGLRGGVIGPRGDLAWLCFPTWDSPAVFNSLMGGNAAYDLHPDEPSVWGGYYEDGTMIWRDRWVTASGVIVECREALLYPGEPHSAVVLRRIRVGRGEASMRALLAPRANYGEAAFRSWRQQADGAWTARSSGLRLRWSGAEVRHGRADGVPKRIITEFALAEGEERDFVLELSDAPLDRALPDPDDCWRATVAAWHHKVPDCGASAAPRDARQAYAVLTGLTVPGGGTAAAVTTSLPERAAQGRNYDYRYAWIRDQCFVGLAAARLGTGTDLLDSSVAFVAGRLLDDEAALAPAYTTTGGAVPGERNLALPGYPGGSAVVGNHAAKQFQLDAFGDALVMFAEAARSERLDAEGWKAAEIAVDAIASRWTEPDGGIWELANERWTQSRLACVAGLNAISAAGGPRSRVARWTSLADAILAKTARGCVHPTGRWQRAPNDSRVDASLLFPLLRGATRADDPRTVLTVQAVCDELSSDGYVYRFKPDRRPLGEAEGAFLLCVFAMSLAALQQGDGVAAVRWFERGRSACGPAGLFTEEFDVQQRQLRGNLPQAFVHAMFLETAVALGHA